LSRLHLRTANQAKRFLQSWHVRDPNLSFNTPQALYRRVEMSRNAAFANFSFGISNPTPFPDSPKIRIVKTLVKKVCKIERLWLNVCGTKHIWFEKL
jgi:hypothetical protein